MVPVEKMRGPSLAPARISSALREHGLGVVRRIVRRRHAEREVGRERPARLREQAARLAADVRRGRRRCPGMIVLPRDVDALRAGRHRDRRRGPTAVMRLPSTMTVRVLDHAGRALDRTGVEAGHRDDARADERDRARRHVGSSP